MTIPTAPMILLWLFIMQVGGIIGYVYAHRRMRNQQRESAIRSSDLESMITRAVEEAVAPLRSRKSQLDDEAVPQLQADPTSTLDPANDRCEAGVDGSGDASPYWKGGWRT